MRPAMTDNSLHERRATSTPLGPYQAAHGMAAGGLVVDEPAGSVVCARPEPAAVFGFPLGFWIAAQGALLIYLLIIVIHVVCMDRMEASYLREPPRLPKTSRAPRGACVTQPPAAGPGVARSFSAVLGRRYALFLLGVAALIGAMAVAEGAGPGARLDRRLVPVVTVAVYASIGFLAAPRKKRTISWPGAAYRPCTTALPPRPTGCRPHPSSAPQDVLYLQGFAGLAYILGWTGGYVLLAVLLAPYLRRFGQYTVPDFLGARYGGNVPRVIGAAAAVRCPSSIWWCRSTAWG